MRFTVDGQPQGKARPRFFRGHAYTPQKTRDYEEYIALCAKQASTGLLEGPLLVEIKAYFQVPRSWPQKRKEMALGGEIRPTGRPDTDNIAKVALDSCNGILWNDDAQVVFLAVSKHYSGDPRMEIEVLAA